jgi:hypothetical protein
MPVPQEPDMEALHEEFLFNYLPLNFPKEFSELCELCLLLGIDKESPFDENGGPPLDKNNGPPIDEDNDRKKRVREILQLSLGEFIWRHHKRFTEDDDYFVRIKQCIRSTETVTKTLEEFVDLFMGMDNEHREVTLRVANEIAPHLFPDQKLGEFLRQLTAVVPMMEVLAAAVSIGTGIPGPNKVKEGRPHSPYISPAYELMQEWQFITAKPMMAGEAITHFTPPDDLTPAVRRDDTPSNLLGIKPAPTPRSLGKGKDKDKDQKARYQEHSTAFIGLCLKMIKPDITPQQVITSIRHAVRLRAIAAQTLENIRAGMPPTLANIEAVIAARKKAARKRAARAR